MPVGWNDDPITGGSGESSVAYPGAETSTWGAPGPWGAGGRGRSLCKMKGLSCLGDVAKGLKDGGTERPSNTVMPLKEERQVQGDQHRGKEPRAGAPGSVPEPLPSCSWADRTAHREHSCRGI